MPGQTLPRVDPGWSPKVVFDRCQAPLYSLMKTVGAATLTFASALSMSWPPSTIPQSSICISSSSRLRSTAERGRGKKKGGERKTTQRLEFKKKTFPALTQSINRFPFLPSWMPTFPSSTAIARRRDLTAVESTCKLVNSYTSKLYK